MRLSAFFSEGQRQQSGVGRRQNGPVTGRTVEAPARAFDAKGSQRFTVGPPKLGAQT